MIVADERLKATCRVGEAGVPFEVSPAVMMPSRIPTDCPRCGKRLYPLAVMPQPRDAPIATAEEDSPFDQIVEDVDKDREIRAWIYAEFVSGRSADEISAELLNGGWASEDVEALVEEGRKATRHRRP